MITYTQIKKKIEDSSRIFKCPFCKGATKWKSGGDCDRRGAFVVYGCFNEKCDLKPKSKEFNYNQYVNSNESYKKSLSDSYKNWKEKFEKWSGGNLDDNTN
jgi:hypothetical protein